MTLTGPLERAKLNASVTRMFSFYNLFLAITLGILYIRKLKEASAEDQDKLSFKWLPAGDWVGGGAATQESMPALS